MTGSEFSSWFLFLNKSLPRLKSQLNMVNADFKNYCPLRGPVREKLLSVSAVGNTRQRLLARRISEAGRRGGGGKRVRYTDLFNVTCSSRTLPKLHIVTCNIVLLWLS